MEIKELILKKGLKANLPTLAEGELGYTTDDKKLYIGDGTTNNLVNGSSGGASIIEITYADLKSKRDASGLTPGQWYRITDYTCMVNNSQTWVKSAGHQFDIIVLATSSNTISEDARAIRHAGDTYFQYASLEAWKLKYNIDNDTKRYYWADSTNGKGVIYYMEDEFGNKCDYDFKNILMLRYEVTASTMSEFDFSTSRIFTDNTSRTNWTIDTSTKNYFYTFSFCANSDLSNLQDLSVMDGIKADNYKAFYGNEFYSMNDRRNIQFKPSCIIICPSGSNTITISISIFIYNNKSLGQFENNTFNCLDFTYKSGAMDSNLFGNSNYSNTFGNDNNANTFGNGNGNNSFGSGNDRNSFGNCNIYNSFIKNNQDNSFGNINRYNSFSNNNEYNSFGNNNDNNSFGDNNEFNSFGNGNRYNSFGNKNNYNSFGDRNSRNLFGDSNESNSFGNNNSYWKVGSSSSCKGCFIGNYIQGNSSSYRTIDGYTRQQYWS